MTDNICFLITILSGDLLLHCALKVKGSEIHDDVREYFMEPESRAVLHSLLPEHIRSVGPIVDVKCDLFDVVDLTK